MKRSTKKGFIYFRYIFPMAVVICMLILMCIPCYRFITPESGANGAVSLGELVGNSWETVRHYLFDGGANKDEATLYFSRYVMGLIIAFVILFVLGVVSAVYVAVSAFVYFSRNCADSRGRALLITLVPNRVLLCIYHALLLPIFLFPSLMPSIYRGILSTYVELVYSPFDMGVIAIALYLAVVVVIIISAGHERDLGMNIFVRRKPFAESVKEENRYEEETEEESLDAYEQMNKKAKDEQMERILRLLRENREKNENNSSETSETEGDK